MVCDNDNLLSSEENSYILHDNIKDLMTPLQQKHYVTPSMNGSYSIKYVLPALVPEMNNAYQELDGVQNGSEAMNAFANMSKLEDDEKEKLRSSLLAYCKLDTLAMVRVLGTPRAFPSGKVERSLTIYIQFIFC